MDRSDKKKLIKKIIVSVIGIAVLIGAIFFALKKLGVNNISKEELQTFISSTGAIAPLIYMGVTFLQIVLIPIPTTIVILVGNYLFGSILCFIYGYISMIIGSIVAFYLGKLIGRPFVNWLSGGDKQTDSWISKLNGKENILLFFMFLFPIFPDDLLCALAGILSINPLIFIIMQLITRMTTITATILFMSGDIIPFNAWGISIIVISILLCIGAFIYCFKNADIINDYLKKIIKRNNQENKS